MTTKVNILIDGGFFERIALTIEKAGLFFFHNLYRNLFNRLDSQPDLQDYLRQRAS